MADPLDEARQALGQMRGHSTARKHLDELRGVQPELPRILMDATEDAPAQDAVQYARDALRRMRAQGMTKQAGALQHGIQTSLLPASRAPALALSAAKASGSPELVAQVEEGKANIPQSVVEESTTSLEHALNFIDKPARAGRALAMSAMGGPSATFEGIYNNTQGDPQQFLKDVKEKAPVLHGVAQAVGAIPGAIGGTVAAGLGAASDLYQGEVPNWGNIKDTIAGGAETGAEFVELAATDPLSYVSMGGSSGSKLGAQAAKAALESGVPKVAAQAIARDFAKHSANILGGVHQGEKLAALAAKHGISKTAFARHFGDLGEVAGKAGLENIFESVNTAKGARPGYEKQAIRQQVGELRRGAQQNEAQRTRQLAEERVIAPKEAAALKQGIALEEKEIAKKAYSHWAKSNFSGGKAMPPDLAEEMAGYFDVGMQGLEGLGPLAPLMNHWKAVHLSGRPGYMPVNMTGDSIQALGAGLKDPRRAIEAAKLNSSIPDAAVLMKDVNGKVWKAGEVRAIANRAGFTGQPKTAGALGHLDQDMVPSAREFARRSRIAAHKAKGAHVKAYFADAPQVAKDVATAGFSRVGTPWAKKWDELFKSTMLLHYLQQGESPANAVSKVLNVAYDYGDPGQFPKLLGRLRQVMPLIGWEYKAATRIPKLVAGNPKMASYPIHAAQALEQDDANPAPSHMRKRGLSFQIPGSDNGETQRARLPDPGTEILGHALNPTQYLNATQPVAKPLYEMVAGKDSLTDAPLGRDWGMFPEGSTGIAALESSAGNGSWAQQLVPLVLGDIPIAAIDKWNLSQGRNVLLGRTPGSSQDPNKASDRRIFNTVTGAGLTANHPGTLAQELVHAEGTKKAASVKGRLKKLKKRKP
jgi:hypothetical protein